MTEQPHRQPLEVLLGRFASRWDAVTARLVGRDEEGHAVTWAHVAREGVDVDPTETARLWEAMATDVMNDPRVQLTYGTTGFPAVVLCVPVGAPDRVAGALCGGFHAEVLSDAPAILWTAAAFAHTVALCLEDPHGFGRMIGAGAVDSLTGCRNPLAMWETLDRETSRAGRQRSPLSCAFIDLDNFKHVNETTGHLNGDTVLAAAGAVLRAGVRGYDTVARFGGDEFVVIMPNSTEKQARALVARLQREITDATSSLAPLPITASVGIAQWRFDEPAASLLERADVRMLDHKRARRNGAPVLQ